MKLTTSPIFDSKNMCVLHNPFGNDFLLSFVKVRILGNKNDGHLGSILEGTK